MTTSLRPLDLNLLPSRYRRQPLPWWIPAGILILAGLMVGLVPVSGAYSSQSNATQRVHSERDSLQTALADRQVGLEELQALDERIADAQVQLVQLEDQALFLNHQQAPRTHGITAAVESLRWVPGLTLQSVTLDGRRLTLTGSAASQGIVFDYARALQNSSSFTNVQIVQMNDLSDIGKPPLVDFTIDAEQ
jgi:Tfp pilus assembly protein PilN